MTRRMAHAVVVAVALTTSTALPTAPRAQQTPASAAPDDTFDVVEKTIPELQNALTPRRVTSTEPDGFGLNDDVKLTPGYR